MAKRSFTEARTSTKAVLGVLGFIELVLVGAAHWDITHRSPAELNGSPAKWRAISLLTFVGPVWYFTRGRK